MQNSLTAGKTGHVCIMFPVGLTICFCVCNAGNPRKMQLLFDFDIQVKKINCKAGDTVGEDDILVELE